MKTDGNRKDLSLSLFVGDIIIFIKKSFKIPKKALILISDLSKVARNNINMQISNTFPHTKNQLQI